MPRQPPGRDEQTAEHRARPRARCPETDVHTPSARARAALVRVDLADQRQRSRLAGGRADAHHDPAGDQRARVVRERADERAGAEERDAAEHHLLAAEQVAERAADQHQPGEGEHVAVDDPLEARDAGPQRLLHVGERDADDRVVEERQEEDRAERGQREAGRAGGLPGTEPAGHRQVIGAVAAVQRRLRSPRRPSRSTARDERVPGVGRGRPVRRARRARDRGAEPAVRVAAKPGVGVAGRRRSSRGRRRRSSVPPTRAVPEIVGRRRRRQRPRRRRRPGRRGSRRRRRRRSSRSRCSVSADRVADVLRDERVVRARRRARGSSAQWRAGRVAAVPPVGEDDRADALPDPVSTRRAAGRRPATPPTTAGPIDRGRARDRAVDDGGRRGAERVLDRRAVRRLHDREQRMAEVGASRSCTSWRSRSGSRRRRGRSRCSAPSDR